MAYFTTLQVNARAGMEHELTRDELLHSKKSQMQSWNMDIYYPVADLLLGNWILNIHRFIAKSKMLYDQ